MYMANPRYACTLDMNATPYKITMHMVTPRHARTLDINIDHAFAWSKSNATRCKMTMHMVHPRHACALDMIATSCKMTMHMVTPRHARTLDINIDHACAWSKPNSTPCQCTICHANHRQQFYHASHRQKCNVLYIMRTIDKNVNANHEQFFCIGSNTFKIISGRCLLVT